jgi:hypothetical protein
VGRGTWAVLLPYEPDPERRTEWHPTEPTGPFKVLVRGAFASPLDAVKWIVRNLRGSAYQLRWYVPWCDGCGEDLPHLSTACMLAPASSRPELYCEGCLARKVAS